jgi:hypothetical protein
LEWDPVLASVHRLKALSSLHIWYQNEALCKLSNFCSHSTHRTRLPRAKAGPQSSLPAASPLPLFTPKQLHRSGFAQDSIVPTRTRVIELPDTLQLTVGCTLGV